MVTIRKTPRHRSRLVLAMAGAVLIAVVAVIAFSNDDSDSGAGSTDPESFDLPAIQGDGRIRLADFDGKPTVVNFFASWCTACDAELPGFKKVADELDGEVNFVGVNAQETGDPMYMPERHDITDWPLASDVGGRGGSGLHEALGGRGMPITAFYDAKGSVVHVDLGAIPESSLRQRLEELYGIATAG